MPAGARAPTPLGSRRRGVQHYSSNERPKAFGRDARMTQRKTRYDWFQVLQPPALSVDRRERWRAACGALAGIAFAGVLCRFLADVYGLSPWLMAPLGASAVLVFALPASPLAQPWSVLVGNTLSALVGVAAARWIPDVALAGAVAVGASILVMFATRSLHPPGGATALLAVLSGAQSPVFALFPAAANSLALLVAGTLYNRLTGRDYPHRQSAAPAARHARFTQADLDAALARYNQVLAVGPADLAELLEDAETQAYARQLGERTVADIMTRDVVTADYAMPLGEAWQLMRERHVKALPVIGRGRHLIGIVTTGDFLSHAVRDVFPGLADRMRKLVTPTVAIRTEKPEVVGEIMTRRVRVVSADRPLSDLLPLLAEGGHHHVPIVDAGSKLLGIVTQTDLIRALHTGQSQIAT